MDASTSAVKMFGYNLYFLPNIILLIKLRIVRWVGHVACVGVEEKCVQDFDGAT